MNISLEAPKSIRQRKVRAQQRSYASLYETIERTPGEWVSVDPDDVTGGGLGPKQSALIKGGSQRGYKIQTRSEGGRIYARKVVHEVPRARAWMVQGQRYRMSVPALNAEGWWSFASTKIVREVDGAWAPVGKLAGFRLLLDLALAGDIGFRCTDTGTRFDPHSLMRISGEVNHA